MNKPAYDIPNIHRSLARDYYQGHITIEQVAADYHKCGHRNFIDVEYARKQMQSLLIDLTARALSCEPTMAAITESLNEFSPVPFKKTIEFDALGILMGVDVQGHMAIHRLKVDDLASLSIEDAEDELQERLVEGFAVFQGFAARVYEEPEREPGCFHNGGCDC